MQPAVQTCGVKGIALSCRKTPGNPLTAQKETRLLQKQSHWDSGLQSSMLRPVLFFCCIRGGWEPGLRIKRGKTALSCTAENLCQCYKEST